MSEQKKPSIVFGQPRSDGKNSSAWGQNPFQQKAMGPAVTFGKREDMNTSTTNKSIQFGRPGSSMDKKSMESTGNPGTLSFHAPSSEHKVPRDGRSLDANSTSRSNSSGHNVPWRRKSTAKSWISGKNQDLVENAYEVPNQDSRVLPFEMTQESYHKGSSKDNIKRKGGSKSNRYTVPIHETKEENNKKSNDQEEGGPIRLDDAQDLEGLCMSMCPPREVEERLRFDELHMLEKESDDPQHTGKPIKKFQRSAADHRLNIPELVRPPKVLVKTLDYILDNIVDKEKEGYDPRYKKHPDLLEVYLFVWDRTRMIRKDFTLQNFRGGGRYSLECTQVHEMIARYHITMEHELAHIEDFQSQHSQQNMEQLGMTLKSLNEFYDYAHLLKHSTSEDIQLSDREAEFRSYFILLTMDNEQGRDVLQYVNSLESHVYHSREVQHALEIFQTRRENNYARFFKILKATTYFNRCLLFKYVSSMRRAAFQSMNKSYGTRGGGEVYPFDELINLLCFESVEEAAETCRGYGLSESSEGVIFKESPFVDPEKKIIPRKMMLWIGSSMAKVRRGDLCRGIETKWNEIEKMTPSYKMNASSTASISAMDSRTSSAPVVVRKAEEKRLPLSYKESKSPRKEDMKQSRMAETPKLIPKPTWSQIAARPAAPEPAIGRDARHKRTRGMVDGGDVSPRPDSVDGELPLSSETRRPPRKRSITLAPDSNLSRRHRFVDAPVINRQTEEAAKKQAEVEKEKELERMRHELLEQKRKRLHDAEVERLRKIKEAQIQEERERRRLQLEEENRKRQLRLEIEKRNRLKRIAYEREMRKKRALYDRVRKIRRATELTLMNTALVVWCEAFQRRKAMRDTMRLRRKRCLEELSTIELPRLEVPTMPTKTKVFKMHPRITEAVSDIDLGQKINAASLVATVHPSLVEAMSNRYTSLWDYRTVFWKMVLVSNSGSSRTFRSIENALRVGAIPKDTEHFVNGCIKYLSLYRAEVDDPEEEDALPCQVGICIKSISTYGDSCDSTAFHHAFHGTSGILYLMDLRSIVDVELSIDDLLMMLDKSEGKGHNPLPVVLLCITDGHPQRPKIDPRGISHPFVSAVKVLEVPPLVDNERCRSEWVMALKKAILILGATCSPCPNVLRCDLTEFIMTRIEESMLGLSLQECVFNVNKIMDDIGYDLRSGLSLEWPIDDFGLVSDVVVGAAMNALDGRRADLPLDWNTTLRVTEMIEKLEHLKLPVPTSSTMNLSDYVDLCVSQAWISHDYHEAIKSRFEVDTIGERWDPSDFISTLYEIRLSGVAVDFYYSPLDIPSRPFRFHVDRKQAPPRSLEHIVRPSTSCSLIVPLPSSLQKESELRSFAEEDEKLRVVLDHLEGVVNRSSSRSRRLSASAASFLSRCEEEKHLWSSSRSRLSTVLGSDVSSESSLALTSESLSPSQQPVSVDREGEEGLVDSWRESSSLFRREHAAQTTFTKRLVTLFESSLDQSK